MEKNACTRTEKTTKRGVFGKFLGPGISFRFSFFFPPILISGLWQTNVNRTRQPMSRSIAPSAHSPRRTRTAQQPSHAHQQQINDDDTCWTSQLETENWKSEEIVLSGDDTKKSECTARNSPIEMRDSTEYASQTICIRRFNKYKNRFQCNLKVKNVEIIWWRFSLSVSGDNNNASV